MNNFIFENGTKVYFGKKCVQEFLPHLVQKYGKTVMLAYGGGSIRKNGIYEEVTELLQKAGKDYPQCNAQFALMDPTYTFSVPKKQMISGSFDILSHIIETYFSEPDEDILSSWRKWIFQYSSGNL